jgi:hypothetical protein
MRERLELTLRRVLEVVLVAATVPTAYAAAIRGQISAVTLGAVVPVLVAISVTIDHLSRSQRGRCVPRGGR